MHLSNYFANSRVKLFLSFFADVSSKTTHCFTFVSKHRCFQCIIHIVSKTRDKLYDIVSRNVKNEFDSVIPTVSIWRRIFGYRSTTEYSVSNFHGNNEVYEVRQRFPSTRKKLFHFERCNNRADLNEELEYL